MPPPTPIETPRLVLREFEPDDWAAVHTYAVLEPVWRYMEWGPNTEADTKSFVALAIARREERPRTFFELAITRRDTGELVGAAGVRLRDAANRSGDLGYALRPDHWGRGFGTEAALALRDFGFASIGLHRLWATCRPENTASAHVLEKIGMRREGHLRETKCRHGKWVDSLLFAMVETDPRPPGR